MRTKPLTHNKPDSLPGSCRVSYGSDDGAFHFAGKSVAAVRRSLSGPFNVPNDAAPHIRGTKVSSDHFLEEGIIWSF